MFDKYEANQFLKDYLGYFEKKLETKITIHSEVLSFKLSSHSFKSYVAGRKVLIGDAAHSIHPPAKPVPPPPLSTTSSKMVFQEVLYKLSL